MIHPRTTILAALTLFASATLVAACSSSSTTTTTNTGKDGGSSGDIDSGVSTGDVDGGGSGDTDSGGSGDTDSGGGGDSGGGTPGAGEACPGPTGAQGGCAAGLECEAFPSKSGNFCTKACTDPGNMTSADCAGNAAFTGKCTPNSYCQLK